MDGVSVRPTCRMNRVAATRNARTTSVHCQRELLKALGEQSENKGDIGGCNAPLASYRSR